MPDPTSRPRNPNPLASAYEHRILEAFRTAGLLDAATVHGYEGIITVLRAIHAQHGRLFIATSLRNGTIPSHRPRSRIDPGKGVPAIVVAVPRLIARLGGAALAAATTTSTRPRSAVTSRSVTPTCRAARLTDRSGPPAAPPAAARCPAPGPPPPSIAPAEPERRAVAAAARRASRAPRTSR